MCGRFASARKRQELLAEFRIERDAADPLEPDYNVAPTKQVYAVLNRGGRDGGAEGGQRVVRELRTVRWGLVPSWATDVSIGSRLINARAETVDSKPAFRHAFARRRCLLPADGFYEWQQHTVDGRRRKQPYYIHRVDGQVLAFAGLYEIWRDRSVPPDHPGAWLWTAAILTTRAEDEVGRIHDRMPMVIEPARWEDWLDPAVTDASGLRALLAPAASSGLVSYPVSAEVNSVRNNGPALIAPVAAAETSPGTETSPGVHAPGTETSPEEPRGDGPPRERPAPARAREGTAGGHARRPARERDPYQHPAAAPLTLF